MQEKDAWKIASSKHQELSITYNFIRRKTNFSRNHRNAWIPQTSSNDRDRCFPPGETELREKDLIKNVWKESTVNKVIPWPREDPSPLSTIGSE